MPHKSAGRLKRVEKLHRLKLQPIFSQASQTDLRVPFDFPWGISGFPCKWTGKYPASLYYFRYISCPSNEKNPLNTPFETFSGWLL